MQSPFVNTAHTLAGILVEVTQLDLWIPRQSWANRIVPGVRLEVSVGSGNKTYCQRQSKEIFMLRYGVKCVEDSLNPRTAANWLHLREIVERQYFGGHLSIANLLAQIALHEFAHVIQNINGWRLERSVHNKAFYSILDRAHAKGHANKLATRITELCHMHRIPIDEMEASWQLASTDVQPLSECSIDQAVSVIDRQGVEIFTGRVRRINKRRVTVHDGSRKILVPPSMLRIIKE